MLKSLPGALSFALLLAACNSSAPPPAAANNNAQIPFDTTTTVKELMAWMIDPNATAIWAATGTVVTDKGEEQTAPHTDAEWNQLRSQAVAVAEAGNLLMMPGRAKDQDDWLKKSRGMIDTAHAVLAAVEAKDVDGLFKSGGDLYEACTHCHAKYLIGKEQKQ